MSCWFVWGGGGGRPPMWGTNENIICHSASSSPNCINNLPDQIFFKNFTILFCWFLRFFFAGCVPILSGFVGFRRDVAGIRIQTQ